MTIAVLGASSLQGKTLIENLAQNETLADLVIALDTVTDEDEQQVKIADKTFDLESPQDANWAAFTVVVGCSESLVEEYADMIAAQGSVLLNMTGVELIGAVSTLAVHESEWMGAQGSYQLPCSTVLLLSEILKRLAMEADLRQIHVSSLMSVSQQGQAGVDELAGQTARLLNGLPVEPEVYTRQIAFNLLSQSEGQSSAAATIEQELPLLFADSEPQVTAHSVSVPVFYGEMALLTVEYDGMLSVSDFADMLSELGSIKVEFDQPVTLVTDLNQHPQVSVTQIRQSQGLQSVLKCCVQADVTRACKVPYVTQIISRMLGM